MHHGTAYTYRPGISFFPFCCGQCNGFCNATLAAGWYTCFFAKYSGVRCSFSVSGFSSTGVPLLRYDAAGHLVGKGWEWTNDDGQLAGIRVMGVLQRIALCYLFASLIVYFFKTRGAYVISFILFMLYWVLCAMLGDKIDPYSLEGYFGIAVDKAAFGAAHMYHGEGVAFDPEGLASTIPAITQVIFGYFVGQYIQFKGKNYEMLSNLFVAGVVLMFAGYWWNMLFPINKKIWTSSYVIYTTGLAIVILSVVVFIIEFINRRGWLSQIF